MKGRHLFISLEYGNPHYYASCNILNDDGLLYVYLLNPKRGSMLFTLVFDKAAMKYKPRHIVPGLDKTVIERINEKINDDDAVPTGVYEANYCFVETGAEYGYMVINRMFVKDGDSIRESGKFHVFQEKWEEINEFEWSAEGYTSLKGTAPGDEEKELIGAAIKRMNAG